MKMLSKAFFVSAAIAGSALLSACATPFPVGCIYTRVTLPVAMGSGDINYSKKGTAECISILGWFASGDASINHACKLGGINRVAWVNQDVSNILGIYGRYTTVVYGDGGADQAIVKQ